LKKARKTNKLEKGAYMFAVHVKPAAEIGVHYAALVNALKEHDRIIITNEGKNEAVLIGMDDYAEYELYAHRRYVQQKLTEAETLAASSNAVWVSEDDFFAEDEA
jgi:prevent-host-death family protein